MSLAIIPPEPPDFDAQNRDAITSALADLDRDRRGDPHWPWTTLRSMTGGLGPGHLIIVGGFTGNGKTALLLNVAEHLTLTGHPWAYAGLELTAALLVQFLSALHCGLSRRNVVAGLAPREHVALRETIQRFEKIPDLWHFLPDSSLTVDDFVTRIVELRRTKSVRVVILDHLHHLDYDKADSLRRGVDRAMRVLKDVAKDTGVTIIASAQLRREPGDKAQAYRVPAVSDLAESGAIERIADIVLMVHREIRPGTKDKVRAYQRGEPGVTEKDFGMPNRLGVTLRKHRFGYPIGNTASLHLDWPTDRLTEVVQPPHDAGDSWEPGA